ncbi:hypothetical protein IEQ34_006138 [Dendrobium chrysotoxum]|uniref:Fe2OG dioxygenase domain-containing protein n=1 Tax=Dendrobium chrysotoxum TaxID=161865 RepID=A0AAV7GVX9_DENCH|nr:hypothetical protein IEQ34_006138 [Dendrobium chrysotoxum]
MKLYGLILIIVSFSMVSNLVWNYAIHMKELLQMIHKMVLEILGLEDHYNSHMESIDYSMRFTKYYNDISETGTKVVMPSHKDPNYISIIGQHNIGGLEIETSNGEWISTTPIKNSFTVLLGEAFMAWTNKIFQAPCHRVKIDGSEERYSIVFSTIPSFTNDVINPPKELVDEEHPLLFKSFKYYDYMKERNIKILCNSIAVDLSGLDLTCLHDKTWAVARANIAHALKKFGGFEAVYDQIGPELRGGLLGQAIPELFEVPDIEKLINPSQVPYHGFFFQKKGFPFLSLKMFELSSKNNVQDFSNMIWPQGNIFFR